MKKIGNGWQYAVYYLGNDRVRKIKLSKTSQLFAIFSSFTVSPLRIFSEYAKVNRFEKESNAFVLQNLDRIDSEILGSPSFLSPLSYDQDKLLVLENFFERCTFEEGKDILDKYTDLILRTWEYGFSDTYYNFTLNNGINKKNNVVLLDFGELTLDKDKVRGHIQNKEWLKSYSFTELSQELKDYFKTITETKLNFENLDKLWSTK